MIVKSNVAHAWIKERTVNLFSSDSIPVTNPHTGKRFVWDWDAAPEGLSFLRSWLGNPEKPWAKDMHLFLDWSPDSNQCYHRLSCSDWSWFSASWLKQVRKNCARDTRMKVAQALIPVDAHGFAAETFVNRYLSYADPSLALDKDLLQRVLQPRRKPYIATWEMWGNVLGQSMLIPISEPRWIKCTWDDVQKGILISWPGLGKVFFSLALDMRCLKNGMDVGDPCAGQCILRLDRVQRGDETPWTHKPEPGSDWFCLFGEGRALESLRLPGSLQIEPVQHSVLCSWSDGLGNRHDLIGASLDARDVPFVTWHTKRREPC